MSPSFPVQSSPSCGRRSWLFVAVFAAAFALGSCSLSRTSPVKATFLLEPALPQAVAVGKPVSVRVGTVSVAAPFRGKAFVYRVADLRFEADYYHEFFVAPSAMLTEGLARALAAANVFRRVVPGGASGDDGEFVLDGFVAELYGDTRDAAATVAVMSATFYLSAANAAAPGVVWSKEYRQRVSAVGTGPEALVRAWNSAASTIFADLARDLAAADLAKR